MINKVEYLLRKALNGLAIAGLLASSAAIVAQSNPVPLLNQPLVPSATAPGSPGFALSVNGTGFVAGASVNWNGAKLATKFVNSSTLTATVPAGNVVSATTSQVSVQNPGVSAPSNIQLFDVAAAIPSLGFGMSNATIGQAARVASADFNGDGKADLVISAGGNEVSVLLGNGDGTFQPAVSYVVGGDAANGIVMGDFNGDGKVDLAVAVSLNSEKNGVLSVLVGNGDGTFQSHVDTSFGFFPTDVFGVAAGDLNSDGKLDVTVADNGSGIVFVLLGNGDGTFRLISQYSLGSQLFSVALGDFNRDGKLDLVAGNFTFGTVSLFLGNGDGTFQTPTSFASPGTTSLTAVDLNHDGKLDVVGIGLPNFAGILLGNGDGTFQPSTQISTGFDLNSSVIVGDFNSDGNLDLATANRCGSDVSCPGTLPSTVGILLGKGDGSFQPRVDFGTGLGSSNNLLTLGAADFNGDGRLDLFSGGEVSSTILLSSTAGLSSGSLVFPLQSVGSISSAMPVTLTNTGSAALTVSSIVVTGTNAGDFAQTNNCPASLAANASCTINVTFSPLLTGLRQATINLTDSALGSPQPIALQGTGMAASITFSPPSVNFGDQLVKQASPVQRVTMTNVGNADLTITSMTVSGDFLQRNPCPATIKVGGTCTFAVAFQPSSIGTKTGAVTFIDSAPGSPHVVNLSGTGTLVQLTPLLLDFGTVKLGQISPPQNVTLTNTSTKTLNISSITATRRDYVVTNNCGSSVAGKASCTITVSFQPVFTGIRNGTLNVGDSGGGSPQMVTLNGAGSN